MDKTIINEFEKHYGFKYTTILPKNLFCEERQMWWFSFDNGYDVSVVRLERVEEDDVFCLAILEDEIGRAHV